MSRIALILPIELLNDLEDYCKRIRGQKSEVIRTAIRKEIYQDIKIYPQKTEDNKPQQKKELADPAYKKSYSNPAPIESPKTEKSEVAAINRIKNKLVQL